MQSPAGRRIPYFVFVSGEMIQMQHENFPSMNGFIQERSDQET